MGLLLMSCAVRAHADPETYVTVSCDQDKGELRIDERSEDKYVRYPIMIGPKDMEFAVSGLVLTKEVPGGFAWEHQPISRSCSLGKDIYEATFRAYGGEGNVQGYCGGNPPTLSLTLSRNGKGLFENLVFDEGCNATQRIETLRVLNNERVIVATIWQRSVVEPDELRFATIPIGNKITSETIYLAAAPKAAP
jgi:hypothetical protein